jgi:hypothetical protein
MYAQNYLLKLENNFIDNNNLSERDLEEKKCFENYYSKILNNMKLSSLNESFFNEKGYMIKDLVEDLNVEEKVNLEKNNNSLNKDNEKNKKKTTKKSQLLKQFNDAEKEIDELIKEYKLNDDKIFNPEEPFKFKTHFDEKIKSRNNPEHEDYKVSNIKEPNVSEGAQYGKFKFNRFKNELNFDKKI